MRIVSIARSIVVGLVAAAVCGTAFANNIHEITNFSNSEAQIETNCSGKNVAENCTIALRKGGHSQSLMRYPFPPANVGLSSGIFSILFPCGTGCAVTFFYSEELGLSKPFSFVLAVNAEKRIILSASDNLIYVYNIFQGINRPLARINLGLKSNAGILQSITGAASEGNGFVIRYVNDNGDEKTFHWNNKNPH
ncbi:hypothetical protein [Paraburkholderia tagetis]|uniref:Uncharacterized protein n=1 Tax=Paraburkholderia tagetis TaxID=2913261 RepID=A0A9X1RLZ7_9BURK|nr:hypothetical protein [Paraburkholderia tagetis]MCG5074701.1 hypothetical protein [Paraburkholderia tagetis]